jgi:hypothetical protein
VQLLSRNLTTGNNLLNTQRSVLTRALSFRQISSFGSSTIRQFTHNVADMKKLAARDFEDILQVRLAFIVPNAA